MNEKTYTQEEAEEMDELIHILRPAYTRAVEWMDQNQARTYRLIHCVEAMMEAGEDNSLWAFHRDQTRNAITEILKDDMNDAEGRRVIAEAAQSRHTTTCSRCGSVNRIVNECRCDPNNLPTTLNL